MRLGLSGTLLNIAHPGIFFGQINEVIRIEQQ